MKPTVTPLNASIRPTVLAASLGLLLSGCSLVPLLPDKSGPNLKILDVAPFKATPAAGADAARSANAGAGQPQEAATKPQRFWETPPAAPVPRSAIQPGARGVPPPSASEDKTEAAVTLESMPLPVFANTVYATILKRNVSIDPSILKRTDLVSLKTGAPVTGNQLSSTAAAVLRSYGVVVLEHDGLVRLVPENSSATGAIELMRSRSQPDVPSRLRPVFHLYEMAQANASTASQWVRTLFQNRITVTDDQPRNAVLLSGQSDAVASAIEALEVLDQPYLRGRFSARINPAFWSAQDMATRLTELLSAQGIYAGTSANLTAPLLLIPVPQVNAIIVFGASPEMVDHALRWAQELDQAPPARRNGRYITYNVRNTDARLLATTLQQLMGGAAAPAAATAAAPQPGGAPAVQSPAPAVGGTLAGGTRVVVNTAGNSLILQTNPDEFAQIRDLLVELDRPPRSALIMATVAEVSLTDTEQFGFNWLLKQFSLSGYKVNGNIGGASTTLGTGGGANLGIASVSGDPRAMLTALATSNRVKVLSNPSIIALNGEAATIQVGQDVPVLTSQISNTASTSATGQSLLQSVQYRNVGIILNVTPVIHSGGKVQLKITQEVSGVSSGATGVGNSPIFTTRKVDTRLSANDGQSMLIGGLIREQRDGGNTGVPLAKDVPLLGALFRSGSNENFTRTELVILLTPYIIEDDVDAQAVTTAFRNQFGWARQLDDKTLPAPRKTPAPVPPTADKAAKQTTDEPAQSQPATDTPVPPKPAEEGPKPYVLKPPAAAAAPALAPAAPVLQAVPAPVAAQPDAGAAQADTKVPPAPLAAPQAVSKPQAAQPAGTKPVADPALLKELQDAIRGTAPSSGGFK